MTAVEPVVVESVEGAPTGAATQVEPHVAHNYHPLPVTIARGEGAWVTDVEGKRYLDLLAAYSAVNFGHRHPALVAALTEQLGRVTLTSRAFMSDRLEPFAAALATLCGKDMVLPMNTGAEAVETGIKVARAWGYRVKGIADGQARIIVAAGNFPRPHHHDRELQRRRAGARRIRTVHAGLRRGRLWRRGCRRRRDHG
ncbi:acetylornithine/succinyldiaminopimelate/putrescine aminotransferase [Microbacterium natoriense]|uniref:Acetylornithine/succinyldiaminopimelate/putresci ne aminotransferase n=1 Tax=Microbacterium natoriense TaxID=284570 RepID=A0AAW8F5A3_9MICO|nr:acetylornithine/succinyldiaminopimelate/putrescine aminotransferase [Microbacterium natoriense]